MMPLHLLLLITLQVQDSPSSRPDCKEWHECRQLALDAAERQDYETFHDLAWRAVQTGPKNEPALMYLLARAQSLSGRPGDALVMLQRLARMGSKTDAATNEDFRRVRALPGWAEFEGGVTPDSVSAAPPNTSAKPGSSAPPLTAAEPTPPVRKEPAISPSPAPVASRGETLAPSTVSSHFSLTTSAPAGLAYDAVSRRFIVGDGEMRRLTVVDEFSQHVANLASAQSAGFGSIAALEIDPRQGNLWVVSGGDLTPAPADRDQRRPTLHKL